MHRKSAGFLRGIVGLVLINLPAFAHESGHGPLVKEKGPKGEPMSFAILAADAEKGAKASGKALTVWDTSHARIEARFLDAKTKAPLKLKAQTVKWIVLFKDAAKKPVVLSFDIEDGVSASLALENFKLSELKTVELILPLGVGEIKDKMVAAHSF